MVTPYSGCNDRVVLVQELVVPLHPYVALVCHHRLWDQRPWEEKPTYLQEWQLGWNWLLWSMLLSVLSISCHSFNLYSWHGMCSRVRPRTPFLVFGTGTGMRVQLDPSSHVIGVDVKRPLEFSQGHLIRHRKDGRPGCLSLELLAETNIDRLSNY